MAMAAQPAPGSFQPLSSGSSLGAISAGAAILGAGMAALGAYQEALSARYKLAAEAADLEFRGSMADRTARAAELDAQDALESGQQDKALSSLRFGQVAADSRAQTAAAGLQAGVGSQAEVAVSIEAAKEMDLFTIDRNALRAAHSARTRSVNARNEARFARAAAANRRIFRGTIKPGIAAATSLVGSAGSIARSFA